MNKYKESFIAISLKLATNNLFMLANDIDNVNEACEKAQEYDELMAKISLTSMSTGIDVVKSLVAQEIVEMLADKDGLYKFALYKDLADKLKEKYNIK